MRRKIAGTVGSVLICALLFAGCGGGTASQQQEGETSMAGSVSESQVDIDVSSSKVEFDDEQVQELRTQAEELFEESEYRKSADTAKKAYDLSQNEEDYNSLIKKIIEMLAKNCGFDNPQALRTTNIYGDMEWYLSCDGISGTPLEKSTEEKIVEKFKEFRQNYHDTLNPYGSLSFSFGNTTIGDFCCDGIWYDVHIDDAFGEKDYVTVYTDDEQHQKITETVENYEARKNMPRTPSGWTTGGPGVGKVPSKSSNSTSNGSVPSTTAGSSSKDSYGHTKGDAFAIAEKAVKGKLKSPSTAKFCSVTEATIGCSGNTWVVRGCVDAQNGFGATIRTQFVVTFTFASKDMYSLDSCIVT